MILLDSNQSRQLESISRAKYGIPSFDLMRRAGDAVAANKVTHAVDMWPEAAGYRDIESNGQKMQGAVERYRTNKVTPPVGIGTSAISPTQSAPAAAPSVSP